ncbi:MAG: hypothetical protein U9Q68_05380 [Euryarchaeota archaeon]|nr:hypothetical protein [Euryarchaeota archaeon]
MRRCVLQAIYLIAPSAACRIIRASSDVTRSSPLTSQCEPYSRLPDAIASAMHASVVLASPPILTVYSPLSPVFRAASLILNLILFCVPESRLNGTESAVIVWYDVVPSLPV